MNTASPSGFSTPAPAPAALYCGFVNCRWFAATYSQIDSPLVHASREERESPVGGGTSVVSIASSCPRQRSRVRRKEARAVKKGVGAHDDVLPALDLAIESEVEEMRRVDLLPEQQQQLLAELEGLRVLHRHLPHRVQPLHEDRRRVDLCRLLRSRQRRDARRRRRPGSLGELVAEAHPLALDKDGEAADRAVVRVHQHRRQPDHLRGAVPAVRAVHQARHACLHKQQIVSVSGNHVD